MWARVIDILEERKQIGPALPLACFNHPDYAVSYVHRPEEIAFVSPDGE
jgi:hypothetical protein